MPAPRTAAVVVLAALTVAGLGAQACKGRAEPGGQARPAGPALSATPRPAQATTAPPASPGAARLEAAGTLRLFCRLIDSGRRGQAQELLAPGAWSRRELRAIDGLSFISARVYGTPGARSLVMRTRLHVHLRAPSPLSNGVVTLFFTLGRVGTTSGSWQITAVNSSP
jgi:hypothetical protein